MLPATGPSRLRNLFGIRRRGVPLAHRIAEKIKALEKQVDTLTGRVTALEEQVEGLLDYLSDPERCKIAGHDHSRIQPLKTTSMARVRGEMRGEVARLTMARELEREEALDRLLKPPVLDRPLPSLAAPPSSERLVPGFVHAAKPARAPDRSS